MQTKASMSKPFPCISLTRLDLIEYIGEDKAKRLDDYQVQRLADKIGESLMDLWWDSVSILTEDM